MKNAVKFFFLPRSSRDAWLRVAFAVLVFCIASSAPRIPYAPFVVETLFSVQNSSNLLKPDNNIPPAPVWFLPQNEGIPIHQDSRLLITLKLENQTPFSIHLTETGQISKKFLLAGFETDHGYFQGVIRSNFQSPAGKIKIQALDPDLLPILTSLRCELLDRNYYLYHDLSETLRKILHLLSAMVLGTLGASLFSGRYRKDETNPEWCQLATIITLSLLMFLALGKRFTPEHGFTRVIQMGSEMKKKAFPEIKETGIEVRSQYGYDGSQYVQAALDPLLLKNAEEWNRALDVPSYRAKRILLPWLSYLAGFGRADWIVQIYSLLNPLFWMMLLFLLCRLNPIFDLRALAVILGIILSTGALESVRRALTDLPSATLVVAALYFVQHARGRTASALICASGLARETALLSLPALWRKDQPIWKNAAFLLVPAGICGLWFFYVKWKFPEINSTVSHNLKIPLVTMWERLNEIVQSGNWSQPRQFFCALAMFSLTVQAVYLLRHPEWKSPWWRMGILFVPVYFCLAMPVWEEYYAVTRAILPMTLAFHFQLRTQTGWPFWAWWIPANLYLWQGVNNWFFTVN